MNNFKLVHDRERLTAVLSINEVIHEMDVTKYFEESNHHDDWLDYRLGLIELAETSKLTKK